MDNLMDKFEKKNNLCNKCNYFMVVPECNLCQKCIKLEISNMIDEANVELLKLYSKKNLLKESN